MKEIGQIRTANRSGLLVAKARSVVRAGTPLFDAKGRKIGTALRTFGPVKAPYVTVRPEGEIDMGILGEKIYTKGDKNAKKEERTRHKGRDNKMPGMRKHPYNKRLRKRRTDL